MTAPELSTCLNDLSDYNIMIVDDQPQNIELLFKILNGQGFSIQAALSGSIALEAIKHQIPDLIILDIRMPEMDGFELCRRMKSDPKIVDIPIIFVSAENDIGAKIKAFSVGGQDYLTKPFEAEEVIARVKTHLTINILKRRLQTANDILEEKVRVRTEALKKNEEKYQDLYNNAPDMFLSVDTKSSTIKECNQTLLKETGYLRDEIVGQSILSMYAPKSAQKSKEKILPQFLKTGKIEGEELQIKKKNGGLIDVLLSASAIRDDKGEIIRSRSSWRDITKRKKAEDDFRKAQNFIRNIINSMPSILVGVDSDGAVTHWNVQARKVTGISVEDAMGQPLVKTSPILALWMDRVYEAMKTRSVLCDQRQPYKKDEEIRYEDVMIYPLITHEVEGAVIRIDDITERVKMEEMMIQSEKMLSLGGVAAGMAHEINSPIAGVIQTANVMSNRLGDNLTIPANIKAAQAAGTTIEAIHEFMESRGILRMLKNINESSLRVVGIVDNMLGFARKSDRQISPNDLSELLDSTVELATTDYDLKKKYDVKSIVIQKEYDNNVPVVACERVKIQQVLLNILRNGSQAMQAEHTPNPTFTLRLRFEKEEKMVRIEIEDNGPGMDEKTRKRVFEPFFSTKPKGLGTGLGLSVSYFIITEDHNGELSVESRPGEGTKFIIRLPSAGDTSKRVRETGDGTP